jgi:hypothetical protein
MAGVRSYRILLIAAIFVGLTQPSRAALMPTATLIATNPIIPEAINPVETNMS